MGKIVAVAERLERWVLAVGSVAKWLFLPLIAVILFDVVARKIPGVSYFIMESWLVDYVSSIRLQEMEWHLHAALLGLILGYVYFYNGHVRIDLLRENRSFRTKLWIEFVGVSVVLIPFVVLLLYFGGVFVHAAFMSDAGSSAMSGLPNIWIIKGIVYFGFVLLLVAGVSVWLRLFVILFGTDQKGDPEEFDELVFPAPKRYAGSLRDPSGKEG